jgi:hypothetical protein
MSRPWRIFQIWDLSVQYLYKVDNKLVHAKKLQPMGKKYCCILAILCEVFRKKMITCYHDIMMT